MSVRGKRAAIAAIAVAHVGPQSVEPARARFRRARLPASMRRSDIPRALRSAECARVAEKARRTAAARSAAYPDLTHRRIPLADGSASRRSPHRAGGRGRDSSVVASTRRRRELPQRRPASPAAFAPRRRSRIRAPSTHRAFRPASRARARPPRALPSIASASSRPRSAAVAGSTQRRLDTACVRRSSSGASSRIGIRPRAEHFGGQRRGSVRSRATMCDSPLSSRVQQALESFDVHRLVQAIVQGLLDQRMVGNLALADEILGAGDLIRKHRREQILGFHALQLRRHLAAADENAAARATPSRSSASARRTSAHRAAPGSARRAPVFECR